MDIRGFIEYEFYENKKIYYIGLNSLDDSMTVEALLRNLCNNKSFYFDKDKKINRVFLCNSPSYDLYNFIENEWTEEKYIYGHNDLVHRGHYIANKFQNYLIPKDKLNRSNKNDKISKFFGRGNMLNVYPQSAESNCSYEMKGQLDFERKVWEFLDEEEGHDHSVFYEVENILAGEKSLGRRIKALFFDNENQRKDINFHVFIPNAGGNKKIPEPKS
ncbi:hypothetical protein QP740_05770 [Aerococcus christensenii]|uniref:Uncharacterized protein n=2 Tax=Aerococcus christensenii TaxID=87541 RepID=A0A133Y439_9LACT|nr:hypothetical protein [Aerococcus christensenii]KXB37957.1 hypothetical protein HMPREF3187_00242 [Aerococcus christensenii]MDK8234290.1 hypothetical protein [Aerococcus christensenii]